MTVDSNEAIPAIAADLEKLAYVKFSGRKAIICLVGESIRETAGRWRRRCSATVETSTCA